MGTKRTRFILRQQQNNEERKARGTKRTAKGKLTRNNINFTNVLAIIITFNN